MQLQNTTRFLIEYQAQSADLARKAEHRRFLCELPTRSLHSRSQSIRPLGINKPVTGLLSLVLALGSLVFVATKIFAAPVTEEPPLTQIYLPLIASAAEPTATPTTMPTATPTATGQPTATPTATGQPTATPTEAPGSEVRGFFVETEWKTTNANVQVDANGGQHIAYAYYEPNTGVPPIGAVYLYCAAQCDQGANWSNVWFQDTVNEVQLALTADGKPRLLLRTDSTVQAGGRDYHYAECNTNCGAPENWTVTLILTSFGTSLFDTGEDNLPQRGFALDPQGRPRFLYLDRNYPIEPDHYGFFYVACDANCSDAANWTQTLVTAVIQEEFFFDWEVAQYPSLTFTAEGHPRFIAELMLLGEQDRATALYYFACDSGCDDRANWGRVKIGERGQGSDLSWDLAVDANGRPRVAHFPESLENEQGERLYYVWCDADCLVEANWQRVDLGLPVDDGQEPDIELDANGNPRIAHADDSTGGLGYSWCNSGCESAANWQHAVVETAEQLHQIWPVPYPLSCDAGLWGSLTPTLSLDSGGNPHIAYDTTYHARCLYQDPAEPNEPPTVAFHLIMRAVRAVAFAQP